ncbi:hypothetical protein QWY93_11030 [Echinicola jeungdonensis]|nr:hypothetical protein [Echinicola jeungdonensis]MDN3669857.1 hypothetical protein [Echinicola jeungdonensis]
MMREDNDPELNGKYLGTITKDFIKVADTLKEASYQVRSRKFSQFPIFPVCKTEQPIGKLLMGNQELAIDWNYYITYLDEFIQRQLIDENGLEDFKQAYKDPDEFCCLFVVDEGFTNFVYIPYPNE